MFLKMETNIIYYSWNANEEKCMICKGDITFRLDFIAVLYVGISNIKCKSTGVLTKFRAGILFR